jgi:Acetyl/propionyl-CoA carboxylase, alpha subunit
VNLGRMEFGILISICKFPEVDINAVTMEKLKTLLIANRGEIAVRIIKTAK